MMIFSENDGLYRFLIKIPVTTESRDAQSIILSTFENG